MTKKKQERVWKGAPDIEELLIGLEHLEPDDDNAMQHDEDDYESTRRSYEAHGQQKPVVVWRDPKTEAGPYKVMAGNGQLEAVRRLGWTHMAVSRYIGSEEMARAYALADNATADRRRFDSLIVGQHLAMLADANIDFGATGFMENEAKRFLDAFSGDGGDGEGEPVSTELAFNILVECADEHQQAELLGKFQGEGITCRALTL